MEKILIVDDNKNMQLILKNILSDEGYYITIVGTGKDAIKEVQKEIPDLVLLDIRLPEINGMEVLENIKKIDTDLLVIMITAYGDIKTAVKTVKLGAYDYITKPFINDDLILTVRKALKTKNLSKEVECLRKKLEEKIEIEQVMGNSDRINKVLKQVDLIAPTDMSVIIQGKSGTGKEVIANMIHLKSGRKDNPFVPIDCGAIPDTLVESELFGYKKGAFTGANSDKKGKFEMANNGTLFLDEIGNLPPAAQAKFLRIIQEKKVQKIGDNKPINVNIRIIVATNQDLLEAVKNGNFRNDLFHRLSEFKILLPLLSERTDDIPVLTRAFLKEANSQLQKNIQEISPDALQQLLSYSWPGNVRELKHVVKRAVLLEESNIITSRAIKFEMSQKNDEKRSINDLLNQITHEGYSLYDITSKVTAETEKEIIKKVLMEVKYNKSKAAKILGIDRNTLYSKIKNLEIQ
ncbi:MAG: sigma-54 dependent transcriptional regulator [Candidatus Cloacimonetes bacterium]|nr:sigma-54 dependent transcriptional regulator [Candidatus Cloacimonadota bacterium]